jgi:hypothetical protein
MPVIKCFLGHEQHVSTDDWVAALTMDQLIYARDQMDQIIKNAQAQSRRTVWLIDDGICVAGFYREEAYADAADHLIRIYKDVFVREAKHFNGSPGSVHEFKQSMPRIEPRRVTQFEYDTEWFPE